MLFVSKINLDKSKWRDRFKTFVKIDENCPFLPWQAVNSRKRHVKWVYTRAQAHGLTTVETSKKYASTCV